MGGNNKKNGSKSGNRWRSFFFFFGIAAIVCMLFTFDQSAATVGSMLKNAGIWFPVIVLLWLPIYCLNAWAWWLIIHDTPDPQVRVPFLKVLKLSISGFALNYTTPFGLMGGEPYRIMELKDDIGVRKASSSVLLYVMMHIVSHFTFWITSILLFVGMALAGVEHCVLSPSMITMLALLMVVFSLLIWLFSKGYRQGFVVKVFGLLERLPWVGKWAAGFRQANSDSLEQIDWQIASLRENSPMHFWGSLLLEYVARLISCVEYWIVIRLLMPQVTYLDSVLIMAFSSFFSNLLFFLPMQLGGREGGLALSTVGLNMPAEYGLYTSLVSRVREFIWIVVGIALIKTGNRKKYDKGVPD